MTNNTIGFFDGWDDCADGHLWHFYKHDEIGAGKTSLCGDSIEGNSPNYKAIPRCVYQIQICKACHEARLSPSSKKGFTARRKRKNDRGAAERAELD